MDDNNALKVYRNSMAKCAADGVGRFKAMNISRDAVYDKFPEMRTDDKGDFTTERARFWGHVNGVINEFYPSDISPSKPVKQVVSAQMTMDIPPQPQHKPQRLIAEIVLMAAQTGFIPKEKYVVPFFGNNAVYLQQAVSRLRSDGWKCEITEYGWITTRLETEEERSTRMAAEQRAAEIKELNVQISLINERLKQLAAK